MKTLTLAIAVMGGVGVGVAAADETKLPTMLTDTQMASVVAAGSIQHPTKGNALFRLYDTRTKYRVVAGGQDVYLGDNPAAPNQGMCNGVFGGGLAGGSACFTF